MSIVEFIVAFIAISIVFGIGDALYLPRVLKRFESQLQTIIRSQPLKLPAGIIYALSVLGVIVFAVAPAVEQSSAVMAAGRGAALGLLLFAFYELTNYSLLKNWSKNMVYWELTYGAFIGAVMGLAGYAATTLIG